MERKFPLIVLIRLDQKKTKFEQKQNKCVFKLFHFTTDCLAHHSHAQNHDQARVGHFGADPAHQLESVAEGAPKEPLADRNVRTKKPKLRLNLHWPVDDRPN